MSKLPKSIFANAPRLVKSAAVNADKKVYWHNVKKDQLSRVDNEHVIRPWIVRQSKYVGRLSNTTDWQNSAIDREFCR
ncbi:hypothetical protein Q6344_09340 [Psychrobacter cibarius]|nr:hypothetical protein Q6344_09340 [Psychrobacter cibarius]